MAGLDPDGGDPGPPRPLPEAHCRRSGQSARRACALSLRGQQGHPVPHPWHQPAGIYRPCHLVRLHPYDQRGRHRSREPGEAGRDRRRPPAGRECVASKAQRKSPCMKPGSGKPRRTSGHDDQVSILHAVLEQNVTLASLCWRTTSATGALGVVCWQLRHRPLFHERVHAVPMQPDKPHGKLPQALRAAPRGNLLARRSASAACPFQC